MARNLGHADDDDDDALPSSSISNNRRHGRWTCEACGCNTNSINIDRVCAICGTMPLIEPTTMRPPSPPPAAENLFVSSPETTSSTPAPKPSRLALSTGGEERNPYHQQRPSVDNNSSRLMLQSRRPAPPPQQQQQPRPRPQSIGQPHPYHNVPNSNNNISSSPLRIVLQTHSDESVTVESELTDDDFTRPGVVRVGNCFNPDDEEVGTIEIGSTTTPPTSSSSSSSSSPASPSPRRGIYRGGGGIIGIGEPSIVEAEIAPDIDEVVQEAIRQHDQDIALARVVAVNESDTMASVEDGSGAGCGRRSTASNNTHNNTDATSRIHGFYLILLSIVLMLFIGGLLLSYFLN